METLKYAQDLIRPSSGRAAAGFNMFVNGESLPTFNDGYGDDSEVLARMQGWRFADKMARNGEIAFTHRFKCECGGFAFLFGGSWVCNDCGGKNVDKEWWKIRVEKDGDQYCCHGLDFINLQESNNYAFGYSFEDAIENYYQKMKTK